MVLNRFSRNLLGMIGRVGSDPRDTEDVRLQKALLLGGSIMFIVTGALWGVMYMALGETLAASIPTGYALISLCSVIVFAWTRRYRFFRFSQLLLILLLPFLLMLALGGFIESSAVILWSLISPMGALLFDEPRYAPRWFLGFLGLVFLSGFLQPYVRLTNNLPPGVVIGFFALNIGTVSAIVFTLLYSFVRQRNATLALLRVEQEKSESLLLNILPKEIAAILKDESRTIADHFDGASILFADMVGFTPLTAQMQPQEMVELLNHVFSYFDSLVDKYGLEKIRTIGDSYMEASGVPKARPDHAQALACMALDILKYVQSDPICRGRLNFRIGMNSGPVVAGVIGRKKFAYDLWGDAVNTASRMESHGTAGKIQITRATYELIRDEFVCEQRGRVAIKGKGEMETWYLVARRADLELRTPDS